MSGLSVAGITGPKYDFYALLSLILPKKGQFNGQPQIKHLIKGPLGRACHLKCLIFNRNLQKYEILVYLGPLRVIFE